MIAALVLVALVAVAGQAQAMPERLHEVQPFFDLPGLKELRCILNELPELSTVFHLASEHQDEMLEAGKKLAQNLVSCAGADHKLDCIDKKIVEFLNAEHTPAVKEVFTRMDGINSRINKCCGY